MVMTLWGQRWTESTPHGLCLTFHLMLLFGPFLVSDHSITILLLQENSGWRWQFKFLSIIWSDHSHFRSFLTPVCGEWHSRTWVVSGGCLFKAIKAIFYTTPLKGVTDRSIDWQVQQLQAKKTLWFCLSMQEENVSLKNYSDRRKTHWRES